MKKCSNFHGGRMRSPVSDGFSFFKIMIGPYKTTLYIPPKAAGRLQNLVDHNAHLEDSNGKCWKVKVSLVENSPAFQQGWDQFVLDHNIVFGEFIVFRYTGGSKFSLQIFGLSGCERLYFSFTNHEDTSTPRKSDLLSDHRSVKRRKSFPGPQTVEVAKGLSDADGLIHKTSIVYDTQFLNIRTALKQDNIPTSVQDASEDMDKDAAANLHSVHMFKTQARKKNMVGGKGSEKYHGANDDQKKKKASVMKEPSRHDVNSRLHHSSLDELEAQITNIEGVIYLVNEYGTCFIDDHVPIEPDQALAAPISVDVSAMTNDVLLSSEAISHDNEKLEDIRDALILNSNDRCDAAIEDPSTKLVKEDDLNPGIAPDVLIEGVSLEENAPINNVPDCPRSPKQIGNAPDVLKEEVLEENAPRKIASDRLGSPIQIENSPDTVITMEIVPSDKHVPQCTNDVFECPEHPKPIGVEIVEPEILALPAPVRFSFCVATEVGQYQELSSSLQTKRMRIDRKVILFRDPSQRVWPVLYHENERARFTGFSSGWFAFASANDVRGGDRCVLEMASEPDALFDVQISRE